MLKDNSSTVSSPNYGVTFAAIVPFVVANVVTSVVAKVVAVVDMFSPIVHEGIPIVVADAFTTAADTLGAKVVAILAAAAAHLPLLDAPKAQLGKLSRPK